VTVDPDARSTTRGLVFVVVATHRSSLARIFRAFGPGGVTRMWGTATRTPPGSYGSSL
jgi:hypothetical protein